MATHIKYNLAKKRKKVANGDDYHHRHSPISNLSVDILINILRHLPTKTIIHCKLVCKEWRNTVNDTRFKEAHYDNTISHLCVVSYDGESDSIYLSELCKNQLLSSRFMVSEFSKGLMFEVVNSCRGFLLIRTQLVGGDKDIRFCFDLHVYNPLTGEHLKLPRVVGADLGMTTMIGLGFSRVRSRYKVIRFVTVDNVTELYVHVVGTDIWRKMVIKDGSYGLQLTRIFRRDERQPLDLNGVLHWLDAHQKIVCFDVEKEELGCMNVPCLGDSLKYIVSIGTVCGLLSVGIILMPGNAFNGVEMWVMREYGVRESWTKYVVLKGSPIFSKPRLVDVCDDDKIVVLPQYPFCDLRVYDRKEERSKKRLKVKNSNQKMTAEVYVPSFFSISRTPMLAKTTMCSDYLLGRLCNAEANIAHNSTKYRTQVNKERRLNLLKMNGPDVTVEIRPENTLNVALLIATKTRLSHCVNTKIRGEITLNFGAKLHT